jgi:UPF0755 protein
MSGWSARRQRWALWAGIGLLAVALALGGVLILRTKTPHVVLTLLPGRSLWQAADSIEEVLPGRAREVLARAGDEAWVRALGVPLRARAPRQDGVLDTWLEGFLFPETYFFSPDASADEVIRRAVRQFHKVFEGLQDSHRAAFAALSEELGLGPAEVVVLASLVEKETGRKDEAPRVAGVFLNRLRRGMRLETDPTLMYRPDRVGRAPTPTERKDATNPYNTYAIDGLPPGPICSPTRASLVAVLEAETHDYLFFVAKRDGKGGSAFATTLDEHRDNIERYLRRPR